MIKTPAAIARIAMMTDNPVKLKFTSPSSPVTINHMANSHIPKLFVNFILFIFHLLSKLVYKYNKIILARRWSVLLGHASRPALSCNCFNVQPYILLCNHWLRG